MGALRKGYIEVAGARISPRGLMIYSLLRQGRTLRWVAEEMGVSLGTMSGYMKRGVKLGFLEPRRDKKVFVAVSLFDGARYEFRGKREVEEGGFNYQAAWHAATEERASAGFVWFFKDGKACET